MRKLIILILLSSVLSACKMGGKVHSFFSPISKNELVLINDSKFIEAISFKNSGDYEKSIELLNQIIKSKGKKAAAYFELAKISQKRSRHQEALKNINLAINLNSKNKWYLNFKINLTSQLGLFEECQETYLLRKKIYPENTDYDIELSDFYIFRKKYLKALKILDEIEEELGVSHDVNYNKFIIMRGLGEYDKCQKEIEKLISAFPRKSEYYIYFADFKFGQGENQSALNIYDEALRLNPNDPYILNELARYYYANNQKEKAELLYIEVIKNTLFELSEKRQLLQHFKRLLDFNNDLFEFTKGLIILAADVHKNDSEINLIAADFMFDYKKYKKSIIYYEKALNSSPDNFEAWVSLLISCNNISSFDKMLEKSSVALDLFPSQPLIYFYSGIARMQLGQYSRSIEILEEGNDLTLSKNKSLKARFLSSLGDVYHSVSKHNESDEYFELSLELDSQNHYVLNNYAYYLSLRGVNLDKARKMSKKSNQLNRGEASFQDTYGWILYQLGEYDESLEWLNKAVLNGGGSSSVINQHLGDVYEMMGQINQAKKYWNQAKKIKENSNKALNK